MYSISAYSYFFEHSRRRTSTTQENKYLAKMSGAGCAGTNVFTCGRNVKKCFGSKKEVSIEIFGTGVFIILLKMEAKPGLPMANHSSLLNMA